MKLLKLDKPTSNQQLWLRTQIKNEWFTLRNKANGRLLTARDIENTVVADSGIAFSKDVYPVCLQYETNEIADK